MPGKQIDLQQHFIEEWRFTRGLTLDLLSSLNPDELAYSPGQNLGPLWKQFRHLGRIQENYADALDSGTIRFTVDRARGQEARHQAALHDYLCSLDQELFDRVTGLDFSRTIDWFGQSVGVYEHLMRLASHETLHHGQWVVYLKLLDKNFPPSWSAWGL